MDWITPQLRVNQYPNDYMVLQDRLYCKICEKIIEHINPTQVTQHLQGKKHKELKLSKKEIYKRQ